MKFLKVFLVLTLVALTSALAAYSWLDSPVERGAGMESFVVRQGDSAATVAARLEQQGLIKSRFLFSLLAALNRMDNRIKAGWYTLSPAMGTQEILYRIINDDAANPEVKLTVPEGFTAREIGERMEELGLCLTAEWMEIVKNPAEYGIETGGHELASLEGFLFPETYFLFKETPCESHAQKMVDQFFKVFNENAIEYAEKQGFSLTETVTLASLIEEEAQVATERKIISAVLRNRLKRDMPLQCDATILYAMPERKNRVLLADLKVDTPYNTYTRKGLPPGPIASPGLSSLAAALKPAGVDYIYYVAAGDGSHVFSRTPAEHERAVNATRAARMRQIGR